MDSLPPEIIQELGFGFLDKEDILNLALCNKTLFEKLLGDNYTTSKFFSLNGITWCLKRKLWRAARMSYKKSKKLSKNDLKLLLFGNDTNDPEWNEFFESLTERHKKLFEPDVVSCIASIHDLSIAIPLFRLVNFQILDVVFPTLDELLEYNNPTIFSMYLTEAKPSSGELCKILERVLKNNIANHAIMLIGWIDVTQLAHYQFHALASASLKSELPEAIVVFEQLLKSPHKNALCRHSYSGRSEFFRLIFSRGAFYPDDYSSFVTSLRAEEDEENMFILLFETNIDPGLNVREHIRLTNSEKIKLMLKSFPFVPESIRPKRRFENNQKEDSKSSKRQKTLDKA